MVAKIMAKNIKETISYYNKIERSIKINPDGIDNGTI